MKDQTEFKMRTYYARLPKVELHRHLEGSLRVESLTEIARANGITLPLRPSLKALIQVQPDDPHTFTSFLSKFQTLRMFYLSSQIISRLTFEVIQDAAVDRVRYLELHFTPAALSQIKNFRMADVMDWVCVSAWQASQANGIAVRLIASINRHEDPDLARQVVELAISRKSNGIAGIDLAGNESEYSAEPFREILQKAKKNGLSLTVHAGEWGGAENVRHAIEELGADRIGHGVRVLEDAQVTALARQRGVVFEVCPTSNYQTGVVPEISQHPLKHMLEAGLKVTINTDDPGISNITLSHEYEVASTQLGLSRKQLIQTIHTAAEASFQPPADRKALLERLQKEIQAI
ncbi:MAG: adenosine deaminase [Anaerolineaceae bacterium]|nr:adenosine deaminase [Anaerolineaceae bacterium]